MAMITTVTPNPSLDRTLHVGSTLRGAVNRARATTVEPSGKGVNVSVALHAAGVATTAVLPVGGDDGRSLLAMIAARGVPHNAVRVHGSVRTNVSVIEDDGTTTKFNEPGSTMSADEVAEIVAAALQTGARGQWIAWCGSLPPGFSAARLADAVAACRAAGRRVALDTSGDALRAVLDVAAPDLVKPNADELADLVGRPLPTLGDVVEAAAVLVERGVGTVAVTLGGAGAVLVDASGALFGRASAGPAVNTAGAGDAFLAGYLAAAGGPVVERLANALRFGSAAVRQAGTLLESVPAAVPVEFGAVDRALRLPR